MSTSDLYEYSEVALMTAGYKLAQWRTAQRVIDNSLLDQAIEQAEWAVEGLRALRDR